MAICKLLDVDELITGAMSLLAFIKSWQLESVDSCCYAFMTACFMSSSDCDHRIFTFTAILTCEIIVL